MAQLLFSLVNGIEVIYNHVILVLKGVSLTVPEGGIVALLGANGAGKTTTLRAVSNLLHGERGDVTKGSIEYRGRAHPGSDCLRSRQARRRAGDGRPPLFCALDRRRKFADRRVLARFIGTRSIARRHGGRSRQGVLVFSAT